MARNSAEAQVHPKRDLQVRCGPDGPGIGPPIDLKNGFATLAPLACGFLPYGVDRAAFRPVCGGREIGMTSLQRRIGKRAGQAICGSAVRHNARFFRPIDIISGVGLCVRIPHQRNILRVPWRRSSYWTGDRLPSGIRLPSAELK